MAVSVTVGHRVILILFLCLIGNSAMSEDSIEDVLLKVGALLPEGKTYGVSRDASFLFLSDDIWDTGLIRRDAIVEFDKPVLCRMNGFFSASCSTDSFLWAFVFDYWLGVSHWDGNAWVVEKRFYLSSGQPNKFKIINFDEVVPLNGLCRFSVWASFLAGMTGPNMGRLVGNVAVKWGINFL